MRKLTLLLPLAVGLTFLAACDSAAPDGSDLDLHAAAPAAFVSGTGSFSADLRVTDPGYTPYGGDIPPLETSVSGTANVTGPGSATVSLSLDHFSSDPLLAAMDPSTITSTPEELRFTVGGQSRTFALEPFMQDALMALTEDAGPGDAKQSGETPFRELSPSQQLQRLNDDGFQVESLSQSRYQLTRTRTAPDGSTFMTTMVYDRSSGAISEMKMYHDGVLVNESDFADGRFTATLHQSTSGRTYEFEMQLPQQ